MLILSIQIVKCRAVAGNRVCSGRNSMQQQRAARSLWVFTYIWGFRVGEEWNEGGGRKGEGQQGLIPSVYRWN